MEDEAAAYEAAKAGRFSMLWTDHCALDAGFGLEPVFSLLPPASKCPSPGMPPFQVVNHMPGSDALVTKDGLLRSLNAAMVSAAARPSSARDVASGGAPTHVFDVCPTTFLVRAGQRVDTDSAWQEFARRFRDVGAGRPALRMPLKHCAANLWALKPVRGAGGSGVRVFSDMHVLMAALRRREGSYLVQKLVERPLLVDGRKATIHTFLLVTDTLDAYVWRGAYARLASVPYTPAAADADPAVAAAAAATAAARGSAAPPSGPTAASAMHARWTHITSSPAQADCEHNEEYEPGNVLPLASLIERIAAQRGGADHGAVLGATMPRVRRILADAVRGAAPALRAGCRGRRCFEIYGADFAIDEDLRPWLVGISECPSLDGPTHEHEGNIRSMMAQALALAMDPIFPAAMARARGDAADGRVWIAPPGPPTGAAAAAAAASATQRAGPPSAATSPSRHSAARSPHGGPGSAPGGAPHPPPGRSPGQSGSPANAAAAAAAAAAASAAAAVATGGPVAGLAPDAGPLARAAAAKSPFSGFDLVFRVTDAPASLDPATDAAFELASETGEAARRRVLAAEAVSDAELPPRTLTFVPARGVVPAEAAASGVSAWWRSGLGLDAGQVLEADGAMLGGRVAGRLGGPPANDHEASAGAATDAAGGAVGSQSPVVTAAASAAASSAVQLRRTRSALNRDAFPVDPSPLTSRDGGVALPSSASGSFTPRRAASTRLAGRGGPDGAVSSPAPDGASSVAGAPRARSRGASVSGTGSGLGLGAGSPPRSPSMRKARTRALDRVRHERAHAEELHAAARRAAALLDELRNKAAAAQSAGVAATSTVSAATIAQLEALAQRLAVEAKAATAAAGSPARVRNAASLHSSAAAGRRPLGQRPSTAGAASRSRSAGRTLTPGRAATPSGSAALGFMSPVGRGGGRSPSAGSRRTGGPASVASAADGHGSRTARRLESARRAQSAHRRHLACVRPRVDTGQTVTSVGLSQTAKAVRQAAAEAAEARKNAFVPKPAVGLHRLSPEERAAEHRRRAAALRQRGEHKTDAFAGEGDASPEADPAERRDPALKSGDGAEGAFRMMTGAEFAMHANPRPAPAQTRSPAPLRHAARHRGASTDSGAAAGTHADADADADEGADADADAGGRVVASGQEEDDSTPPQNSPVASDRSAELDPTRRAHVSASASPQSRQAGSRSSSPHRSTDAPHGAVPTRPAPRPQPRALDSVRPRGPPSPLDPQPQASSETQGRPAPSTSKPAAAGNGAAPASSPSRSDSDADGKSPSAPQANGSAAHVGDPQPKSFDTPALEVWIETPAPAGSAGGSVYFYRASDRVVQWERPTGSSVLVMTRAEAAQRAAATVR